MGRTIAWVCMVLLSAVTVARAEKVPNPQYEQWSKFKVGAFAKMESETVAAGTNSKSTTTQKLIELTPDKATLEVVNVTTVMGRTMEMPPQQIEVPATIEKTPEPAIRPKMEKGEETLKVAGKDVKTAWTQTISTQDGTTLTVKTWTSPEVPGGVVKMTSNGTGTLASTVNHMLVEFGGGK